MRQFLISITALLASIAVLLLGVGLMGTLVSVRLTFEDIHPQMKGLILSAYYIGLVLGTQYAGRVIEQAGHIRAFAVFAALSTAAILFQGLYVAAELWVFLRILIGFSISGIYIVVESWLNERADPASRGRVFSIYQVITYAAIGAGQLLLYLGDPVAAELFMIVGVLFALCLVPVALSRASNPPEPLPHTRMALLSTCRSAPLAVVTCVGAGLLSSAAFTLMPMAGLRLGLTVEMISPLMASLVLGGVMLQWPIGHFSDTLGRRPMIFWVGLATTAMALVMGWVAGTVPLWALMLLAGVFGGLAFTFYPLAVSLANDIIRGESFVAVSGALIFLWGVGAVTGPLVGGWILGITPPGGLFVYMGVISGLVTLSTLPLRSAVLRVRNPFRVVTRHSPVLAEMDPRAREEELDEDTPEWYR